MDRIEKQIIQALVGGTISIYKLIDLQDASLPEFFSIIKELENKDIIEIKNGKVRLTKQGKEYADKIKAQFFEITCECCDGSGIRISGIFSNILEKYKEIAKERPEAEEKYDQGYISPEGVIRRVEFVYERGDLLNSKIFVVGDDDLFSIASALTRMPEKIVVVDIDERLVKFINKIATKLALPIKAEVYDVQRAFPERYRKKFDIFITDPVETIPGLKLFLSRGVSTLKGKGCSGYFGITTLEASRKKWYEIQEIIHEMGFVITDMKRKFNVYPEDEKNFFRFQDKLPIVKELGFKIDYDWYKSTLYRIEAVKEPKPVIEGEMILDDAVYRDDESWATPYGTFNKRY